jgi:hypothetical protein
VHPTIELLLPSIELERPLIELLLLLLASPLPPRALILHQRAFARAGPTLSVVPPHGGGGSPGLVTGGGSAGDATEHGSSTCHIQGKRMGRKIWQCHWRTTTTLGGRTTSLPRALVVPCAGVRIDTVFVPVSPCGK